MNRAQRRHKARQNKLRNDGTPYATERNVNNHRVGSTRGRVLKRGGRTRQDQLIGRRRDRAQGDR